MYSSPHIPRRCLLLTGIASALLAGACSKSGDSGITTLPKGATILCLGDSWTFGYGAPEAQAYPQLLERLTGHATKNAGLNGDTTDGALARLPELLQHNHPALVLVCIGVNDFLQHSPIEATRDALRQIIKSAKAEAQVVLIAVPLIENRLPAKKRLKDHPLYAELAEETKTPLFADVWSSVLSRKELCSDTIHANAEGYRVFTTRLAQWLRQQKFVV